MEMINAVLVQNNGNSRGDWNALGMRETVPEKILVIAVSIENVPK
jgi:hypothetical protein